MLTILQVLPSLNGGGVERGTLEVAKYLVQQGHRSLVMSAGGHMVTHLQQQGTAHFCWPIGKKSLWSLRLIWQLRRFLIEQKVDVLHVRSRMPAWLCYLAWRGMPPKLRPHLVTTVHGLYSVNPYSEVMTKAERVIVVSKTARDYVLKNYPDTSSARIVLIPRGVDPADFAYGYQPTAAWLSQWQSEYPKLTGKWLLTLPGRLTRLKGHEAFITLIGQLKQNKLPVHGLIVGGASPKRKAYVDEVHSKIMQAGMDDTITVMYHRDDLKDILSISRIVFSLSSRPESFGRTTLEALSLGVPVVGYDHGGVGEILSALFPAGKVALGDNLALIECVRRTLEHPPKMSPVDQFQLQTMLERTLQTYQELVSA